MVIDRAILFFDEDTSGLEFVNLKNELNKLGVTLTRYFVDQNHEG